MSGFDNEARSRFSCYLHPVTANTGYELVHLQSGAYSIRSLEVGETFHPVIGPVAEAEALYVNQLKIAERLRNHSGKFVIWDVGLGAAANVLTVLRATREIPSEVHVVSFDRTIEPLCFALQNRDTLGYFGGFENAVEGLLETGRAEQTIGAQRLHWETHVGDFPTLLNAPESQRWPKPDVILFDAFSPARNPDMWTVSLFKGLFQLLDPSRPCSMATYSRSTMFRTTLLMAGFFVGAGHPTGFKEETTMAANSLSLIEEPLGERWLKRARVSSSAEPIWEANYKPAPLTESSWARLLQHPQFKESGKAFN